MESPSAENLHPLKLMRISSHCCKNISHSSNLFEMENIARHRGSGCHTLIISLYHESYLYSESQQHQSLYQLTLFWICLPGQHWRDIQAHLVSWRMERSACYGIWYLEIDVLLMRQWRRPSWVSKVSWRIWKHWCWPHWFREQHKRLPDMGSNHRRIYHVCWSNLCYSRHDDGK